MSDFTPKDLSSEHLSSMMAGARDGQIIVSEMGEGHVAVAMKCSHVDDGACSECVRPTVYALIESTDKRHTMERRIATLEARLARLCQYAANRSALHRTRAVRRVQPGVIPGRVWSRKRTGGRRP